jgi:hypothetical protein
MVIASLHPTPGKLMMGPYWLDHAVRVRVSAPFTSMAMSFLVISRSAPS